MRVLVTGATGFVGGRLVPALLAASHDVSVLVRDRGRFAPDGYAVDDVRVVEGDLLAPAGLEPAFADVEAAYYLVHSMRAGGDFEERDRLAARSFARLASDAGVSRVVYLGGLGETHDHLSDHLRSRREVEAILGDGPYDLTVLRAAVVIGAGSASFEMVRQLATRLPVMVTPRWVRTPCQPIAVTDVIGYLVGVLDHPETAGETYEVGGPEVLTYEEMLRRTARLATGREPLILPVPVLSPQLSTYWVDLVTDVPSSVARPLILGLKNPVDADDRAIRECLPIPLTPFDDAVAWALREGGHRVGPREATGTAGT